MVIFMNLERQRLKSLNQIEKTDETKDAKKIVCFKCCKEGHKSTECKSSSSGKNLASSHSSMKTTPPPCPACSQQHPFQSKGETLYCTRLASCPAFQNSSTAGCATMVQTVNGCQLCLDWTGTHQRDNCTSKSKGKPYSNCNNLTSGKPCGLRHNPLLHGTQVKYVNYVQVNSVKTSCSQDKGDFVYDVPSLEEIGVADECRTRCRCSGYLYMVTVPNVSHSLTMARTCTWWKRPIPKQQVGKVNPYLNFYKQLVARCRPGTQKSIGFLLWTERGKYTES